MEQVIGTGLGALFGIVDGVPELSGYLSMDPGG
jgi:hypothetical protein